VHNPLAGIVEAEQSDALSPGVLVQLLDHARDLGISDRGPVSGRHVMIGHAECQRRLGHLGAARLDLVEALERALMHEMAVDP
jgi:hypothetical protein